MDLVEEVAREICLAEGLGPDSGVYDGRDHYLGKAWERRIPHALAVTRLIVERCAGVARDAHCWVEMGDAVWDGIDRAKAQSEQAILSLLPQDAAAPLQNQGGGE